MVGQRVDGVERVELEGVVEMMINDRSSVDEGCEDDDHRDEDVLGHLLARAVVGGVSRWRGVCVAWLIRRLSSDPEHVRFSSRGGWRCDINALPAVQAYNCIRIALLRCLRHRSGS